MTTTIRDTGLVQIPVSLADLKLLKQMTTLGIKKEQSHNGLNMIHFVIDKDEWFAWTTDSYVLGITQFVRQDSSFILFDEADNKKINTVDRIYAAVKITEFNKIVTEVSKFKKDILDDLHIYLTFIGKQRMVWESRNDLGIVTEDKYYTCMQVGIEIEYVTPFVILNRADKLRQSIPVFNDFWNDQKDSLSPDNRRPITNLYWSPTHLKRVMNFFTCNSDDHFTYMYQYEGKYHHAALFNKTCSGKDSATNKFAWVMPMHIGLDEK